MFVLPLLFYFILFYSRTRVADVDEDVFGAVLAVRKVARVGEAVGGLGADVLLEPAGGGAVEAQHQLVRVDLRALKR
jgi:hypothetical protein